jgi:hypothetical protein
MVGCVPLQLQTGCRCKPVKLSQQPQSQHSYVNAVCYVKTAKKNLMCQWEMVGHGPQPSTLTQGEITPLTHQQQLAA